MWCCTTIPTNRTPQWRQAFYDFFSPRARRIERRWPFSESLFVVAKHTRKKILHSILTTRGLSSLLKEHHRLFSVWSKPIGPNIIRKVLHASPHQRHDHPHTHTHPVRPSIRPYKRQKLLFSSSLFAFFCVCFVWMTSVCGT